MSMALLSLLLLSLLVLGSCVALVDICTTACSNGRRCSFVFVDCKLLCCHCRYSVVTFFCVYFIVIVVAVTFVTVLTIKLFNYFNYFN